MKVYKGKISRIGNHSADGQQISVLEIGEKILWRVSTHSRIMAFIDIGDYSEIIVIKDIPFLNQNVITQIKTGDGRVIKMPIDRLLLYVFVGVILAGIIPLTLLILLSMIEPYWFHSLLIPFFIIRLIRYFYATYFKFFD